MEIWELICLVLEVFPWEEVAFALLQSLADKSKR
jgi:hypothetical protein